MASVDVVELSGIGPAIATRLNELGVFSSSDLLRVSRRRLADLVDGVSVAQVRRWQGVAEFLEVDGVPLPVAEGLYERGVESLDELGSRPLSVLRGLVGALEADGVATANPSDDELVRWIVDAVRLRATGVLNGTVVDAANAPIAAVAVSCLEQHGVTDAVGSVPLASVATGPAAVTVPGPCRLRRAHRRRRRCGAGGRGARPAVPVGAAPREQPRAEGVVRARRRRAAVPRSKRGAPACARWRAGRGRPAPGDRDRGHRRGARRRRGSSPTTAACSSCGPTASRPTRSRAGRRSEITCGSPTGDGGRWR